MKANETLAILSSKFLRKSPYTRAAQPTFPLIQYHTDTCTAFARALTTWKARVPQYLIYGGGEDEGKEAPDREEHQSPCCPVPVAAVPPHLPSLAAATAVRAEQAACSCSPLLLETSAQVRGSGAAGGWLQLHGARVPRGDGYSIATCITALDAVPAKSCRSGNLN